MPIKTVRNGVCSIIDGSGTPKTLEFSFDGELKIDVPGTDVVFHKDRGVLPATGSVEATLGEDNEITFTLNAKIKLLTDATAATMMDLINALGGGGHMASNWTSTVTGSSRLLVHFKWSDGTSSWTMKDSNIVGTVTEGTDADMLAMSGTSPHPYPVIATP